MQLLERAVQGEERPAEHKERQRSHSDEWLTLSSTPMRELDLEPLDYQLDLSKEVAILLIGIVHPKRSALHCALTQRHKAAFKSSSLSADILGTCVSV